MISGTSTSIVFLFLAFSCYPFCGKEDGRLLLQEVEVLEALVAIGRIQPLHLVMQPAKGHFGGWKTSSFFGGKTMENACWGQTSTSFWGKKHDFFRGKP